MSAIDLDPNIIHSGLDSGALTLLGAVVHQFPEPGKYRGTVRRGDATEKVFYLSVDEDSPVASADIDLAKLARSSPRSAAAGQDCCPPGEEEKWFGVNPRGYVLFHVSGGRGGYSVNMRRADAGEKTRVFNSTALTDGARFSARILQPGEYSVTNVHGEASALLTVAPVPKAFSGYRPPEAVRVEVTERGFEPERVELMPAQGLVFECRTPARIVIALERAGDERAAPATAT